MKTITEDIKRPYLKVFITAFVIFMISTLPVLIMSKGVYIYISDYNAQTIPFLDHASDLLHSEGGLPVFDWQSGLGMDYMLDYSGFVFSPFALLLIIMPPSLVPYLHGVFVGIKIGVAAVTSMLWFRQYLKKSSSAYICGLLYAFSGFQLFNLVFQFADSIALFPLLIYAFDKLVSEKRPFGFALMLAVFGLMNIMFLWSECVFLLIYYIVRTATGSFPRVTVKGFLQLAVETLFGVFMAGITIIPYAINLLDNPRATDTIFSNDLLAYNDHGTVLKLIESLFLFPEVASKAWYFNERDLAFSAPGLYIPLFTIIGVLCVMKKEKKSWYSIMLYVSAVFACVPVLNSMFTVFNATYYARWTFMPLIIMILMTGMFLDDYESFDMKAGIRVNFIVLCILIPAGLYNMLVRDYFTDDLQKQSWIYTVALCAFGLLYMFLLSKPQLNIRFARKEYLTKAVAVFCCLMFFTRYFEVTQHETHMQITNYRSFIYNDFHNIDLNDDGFYRVTGSDFDYNTGITMGYDDIRHFTSMTSGSETDFYSLVGIYRTSGLHIDSKDYPLYSFLSAKYNFFFNKDLLGGVPVEPKDALVIYEMTGYSEPTQYNKFIVLKNNAYIPMGFTYDHYINQNEFTPILEEEADTENENRLDKAASEKESQLNNQNKPSEEHSEDVLSADDPSHMTKAYDNEKLLLKAIWLNDEQIEKYGDILTELPKEEREDLSLAAYYADCKKRADSACYEFNTNSNGFTAKTKLEKDNLVFFSVPYSDGFTAFVDGKETEIEKVFGGLMAVYVPEGDHDIKFEYVTPGLKLGMIISGISAAVIAVYGTCFILIRKRSIKKNKSVQHK